MTRTKKSCAPKFPDSYIGKKAEEYDSLKWMERNQKKSAIMAIKYLFDEKIGGNIQVGNTYLILDLGCGTGYSSEILIENGFKVVGVDVLNDMLIKAHNKKNIIHNHNHNIDNLELILADINYLPLKSNSIDHIISISAYNFITYNRSNLRDKRKTVNKTAKYLYKILKNKRGRIVIEFYPENEQELNLFVSSFKENGFDGFVIKNKPNQKSGQTYLLLKKNR